MGEHYRILAGNHYLSTQVGLIREWQSTDAVAFSQLVDFTTVDEERQRVGAAGEAKPSYTAFAIDSIARALKDHPKLNRIVWRGWLQHRWVEFENIDIAVAVEAMDEDVDIAYASIVRNADQLGVGGIMESLRSLSTRPFDDPQIQLLKKFPAAVTSTLAKATRLHPESWVKFRGGSCAFTSPAKYGVEGVIVKGPWPIQFALGNVKQRPMVVDGECVPRVTAMLSMSWHRQLTTGAVAARFFEQCVQGLQGYRRGAVAMPGANPSHAPVEVSTY